MKPVPALHHQSTPTALHVFVQTMRQSNCLPCAATCSNALYLPEYSSVDMAYKKLLYTTYNCMTIDTDG